jgi:outer membrane immunogenic protein
MPKGRNVKKILLTTTALMALGIAPAAAADLAARPYTKAPVAAAVYDWTGFYIGANGGGAWSRKCWDVNNILGIAVPATSEGCHDATGAVAGGQVGYRWQAGTWVFGLEAQGDWADLSGSNTSLVFGAPITNRSKVDALGLFTGQVGFAWNNILWYVKGGAAVTRDKYEGAFAGAVFDRSTETRWGGVVGTGIEFGFAPNWSFALEYDHLFMGTRDLTFVSVAPPVGIVSRGDRIRQDVDMVTARINYRFGGPGVAKY